MKDREWEIPRQRKLLLRTHAFLFFTPNTNIHACSNPRNFLQTQSQYQAAWPESRKSTRSHARKAAASKTIGYTEFRRDVKTLDADRFCPPL